MLRLAVAGFLLAACGQENDDRPLTAEYITETIMAPTCGAAPCHSQLKQARGDVFDTLEGMRASIVHNGLVVLDSTQYDPADAANAALIIWLTKTDPFGLNIGRMPYDAPMPNEDILFIEKWIKAGAPGAQCDPDLPTGMGCNNKDLVRCNTDWTFGAKVETCPTDCIYTPFRDPNNPTLGGGACS